MLITKLFFTFENYELIVYYFFAPFVTRKDNKDNDISTYK